MKMKTFDISSTQNHTILTEIHNPGLDTHRLTYQMKFPLKDYEYLKEALNILISGNLLIRLNKDENNKVTQYYHNPQDEQLYQIKDLTNATPNEVSDYIKEFTEKPFKQIFNTNLFHFILVKKHDENLILAKIHHTIFDGTSKTIFYHKINECITALKNGETYPQNPQNYQKYVEAEKKYLNSKEAEKDHKYWVENLKGYKNEYLNPQDLHYTSYDFPLKNDLTHKIEELRNIEGVKISPFVIGLAVSSLYFNRANHTSETVWNTTYHGRNFGEEVDKMLGMFINILPMKIEYNPEINFKQYLLQVKNVLKASLTHGRLNCDKYHQEIIENNVDPECIANYSIVSNASNANIKNLFADYESSYPLHIRVNRFLDDAKGLQLLSIEANNECFKAEQVNQMGENIIRLLEQISMDSDKKLKEYNIGNSTYFNSRDYYNNLLKQFNNATSINPDLNNTQDDFDYTIKSLTLPAENINHFSKMNNLNPNTIFLASSILVLAKFTSNVEVLINNVSNLNKTNSLGKYWRLPIGVKLNPEEKVLKYLQTVRKLLNQQIKHSDYPINNVKDSKYQKQLNSNFLYTYNESNESFDDFFKFPFNLNVKNDNENFILNLIYHNKSYSTDLVDHFLNKLINCIDKSIFEPNLLLKDLESYEIVQSNCKVISK